MSKINDYIKNNLKDYKEPNEETANGFINNKTDILLNGNDSPDGKGQGMLIHETGNPNSEIDGEVKYMIEHQDSAFVHGFINGERNIATANDTQQAWGAGPKANPWFVQVEMVEMHSMEAFAKEVYQMALMTVRVLKERGLDLSFAKADGTGSVWYHAEVSQLLGGTDHSDPTGYFAENGYSIDEHKELIKMVWDNSLFGKSENATMVQWDTPMSQGSNKPKFKVNDQVDVKDTATNWAGGESMTEKDRLQDSAATGWENPFFGIMEVKFVKGWDSKGHFIYKVRPNIPGFNSTWIYEQDLQKH